jgi:hypothetical protein
MISNAWREPFRPTEPESVDNGFRAIDIKGTSARWGDKKM